jgi:DNA-cytosine methyltransferase
MDTTKAITHVSLCAGYGGIDIGLSRAIPSLRTVAFSEIEAFACANLVSKMEAGLLDAAPIWTNLKTFPWAEFHGRVDILSGGYPCQPFSSAGKRLGTEDPRHLWPYIADGIRAMRPRMCFFENVEGHISLGLREVVGELESIGYKVSWGIFSAREVGAPHQRKRVFIMAYCKDIGLSQFSNIRTGWDQIRTTENCGELADSNKSGLEGSLQQGVPLKEKQDELITRCSSTLADTNGSGSRKDWESTEPRPVGIEQSPRDPWGSAEGEVRQGHAWPSRPGEPQHGWEPPRVVANPSSARRESQRDQPNEEWGQGSACESGELGNTKHDGSHQCSEKTGGTESSSKQGRVQEFEGGSASMGDTAMQGSQRRTHGEFRQSDEVEQFKRSNAKSDKWNQTQPTLGGDIDGSAGGMGYAELSDADSAMREDDAGTVDRSMANTISGRGQQTWSECGCREVDQNERREEGARNQQATFPYNESDDGGASYEELCLTCDNRTDELRLLGNGVVPATAEGAFRTLLAELNT